MRHTTRLPFYYTSNLAETGDFNPSIGVPKFIDKTPRRTPFLDCKIVLVNANARTIGSLTLNQNLSVRRRNCRAVSQVRLKRRDHHPTQTALLNHSTTGLRRSKTTIELDTSTVEHYAFANAGFVP